MIDRIEIVVYKNGRKKEFTHNDILEMVENDPVYNSFVDKQTVFKILEIMKADLFNS